MCSWITKDSSGANGNIAAQVGVSQKGNVLAHETEMIKDPESETSLEKAAA